MHDGRARLSVFFGLPGFAGQGALMPANRSADEVLCFRPEVASDGSSRNLINAS
jgi:hypothetical protein